MGCHDGSTRLPTVYMGVGSEGFLERVGKQTMYVLRGLGGRRSLGPCHKCVVDHMLLLGYTRGTQRLRSIVENRGCVEWLGLRARNLSLAMLRPRGRPKRQQVVGSLTGYCVRALLIVGGAAPMSLLRLEGVWGSCVDRVGSRVLKNS